MHFKKSWGYVFVLMGFLSLFFGGLALSSGFIPELLMMNNFIENTHSLTDSFTEDKDKNTLILFMGLIFSVLGAYMMKGDLSQEEKW